MEFQILPIIRNVTEIVIVIIVEAEAPSALKCAVFEGFSGLDECFPVF
jgi:hypothetical protein